MSATAAASAVMQAEDPAEPRDAAVSRLVAAQFARIMEERTGGRWTTKISVP